MRILWPQLRMWSRLKDVQGSPRCAVVLYQWGARVGMSWVVEGRWWLWVVGGNWRGC